MIDWLADASDLAYGCGGGGGIGGGEGGGQGGGCLDGKEEEGCY